MLLQRLTALGTFTRNQQQRSSLSSAAGVVAFHLAG
jgi:hypothetical protein